jgi:hypothetical protein
MTKKKKSDCRGQELQKKVAKYEHRLCKAKARQQQNDVERTCAKEKRARQSAKQQYKACKKRRKHT